MKKEQIKMKHKCPFCKTDEDILFSNSLIFALFDNCPVSKGHILLITKRHFDNFFEATEDELKAIDDLLKQAKNFIDNKFNPDGYNIGVNCGEVAGQSVMHLHIHLIPRYKGDMENPLGGVRGVIPEKQKY
jgi:diadenosine tetraphosphate (Ap4A) HIT family hydrolase